MKGKQLGAPQSGNVLAFPASQSRSTPGRPSKAPRIRLPTTFCFRLRNGFTGECVLPEKEATRLWYQVQQPDDFHYVAVFDSLKRRVALNLKEVVAAQFDRMNDGPLESVRIDDDENETACVVFANSSTPLEIEIDPDLMTIEEFDEAGVDDNDLCQIANLFHYFEMMHEGLDYPQRLRDADGAIIWLRLIDIPLCTAPLSFFAKKKRRRKPGPRKV